MLDYLGGHPLTALAIALAAVVAYRLLNRKSKLVRDAEEEFNRLKKERGEFYNKPRPPL